MQDTSKSLAFDFIFGIISFIISYFLFSVFDLTLGSICLAFIGFSVGIIRGKAGSPILLKCLGLTAPFFLFMAGALNGVVYLFFLFVLVVINSLLGIYVRRNLTKKLLLSSLFIIGSFVLIYFFAVKFLPWFLEGTSWNESKKHAPNNFFLIKPKGDTLYSEKLKNKVLILDFWATWCGPCKEEFPELEKIYLKYKNDTNVVFLLVAAETERDPTSKIQKFVNSSKYKLPFAIDLNRNLEKKCNIWSLPTLLMIDKKGIVRYSHHGYNEIERFGEEFELRIQELLK
jgi:thiol-disulfide isomerase/thioredoxin